MHAAASQRTMAVMRTIFWATLFAFVGVLVALAFGTPEWTWQRKVIGAAFVAALIVGMNLLRQLNRSARRNRSDMQP